MKEKLERAKELVNKGYSPLKAVKIAGVLIEDYNKYVSQDDKKVEPKEKLKEQVVDEVNQAVDEVNKEQGVEVAKKITTKDVKVSKVKKYNKKK